MAVNIKSSNGAFGVWVFFNIWGLRVKARRKHKGLTRMCVRCVCICVNNLKKLQPITAALNGLGTIGGRQEEEGQVPPSFPAFPPSIIIT